MYKIWKKISIDSYDICFKYDNGRMGCFPMKLPKLKLMSND